MIISACERERSRHTVEELCTPARIACLLATGTGPMSLAAIGVIGVQTLFDSVSGKAEHLPAHCRFQSFQVDLFESLASEQRFNVPQDVGRQQSVECGFFYCRAVQDQATGATPYRKSVRKRRSIAAPGHESGDTHPPAFA